MVEHSLSRSQTALAHLDEVVLQIQIVSTISSKLVVKSVALACDSNRLGRGSNPFRGFLFLKFVKLFFLYFFTFILFCKG